MLFTLQILLSVSTCDVNAADSDFTTPLHMAAIQGSANIVEMLVSTFGARLTPAGVLGN